MQANNPIITAIRNTIVNKASLGTVGTGFNQTTLQQMIGNNAQQAVEIYNAMAQKYDLSMGVENTIIEQYVNTYLTQLNQHIVNTTSVGFNQTPQINPTNFQQNNMQQFSQQPTVNQDNTGVFGDTSQVDTQPAPQQQTPIEPQQKTSQFTKPKESNVEEPKVSKATMKMLESRFNKLKLTSGAVIDLTCFSDGVSDVNIHSGDIKLAIAYSENKVPHVVNQIMQNVNVDKYFVKVNYTKLIQLPEINSNIKDIINKINNRRLAQSYQNVIKEVEAILNQGIVAECKFINDLICDKFNEALMAGALFHSEHVYSAMKCVRKIKSVRDIGEFLPSTASPEYAGFVKVEGYLDRLYNVIDEVFDIFKNSRIITKDTNKDVFNFYYSDGVEGEGTNLLALENCTTWVTNANMDNGTLTAILDSKLAKTSLSIVSDEFEYFIASTVPDIFTTVNLFSRSIYTKMLIATSLCSQRTCFSIYR